MSKVSTLSGLLLPWLVPLEVKMRGLPSLTIAFPIDTLTLGKIPARYYTTTDSASLDSFLSECDILVASLPSTKETQYLLDARSLGESVTLDLVH